MSLSSSLLVNCSLGSFLNRSCDSSNFGCSTDELESVKVKVQDCKGQLALARFKSKEIILDPQVFTKSGVDQVAYVVFELCNLRKASEFEDVFQNENDVNSFVSKIEKLEHESALKTQELMEKAFGPTVSYELKSVDSDFTKAYALQQLKGHSQWIAKKYFPQATYSGTIAEDLRSMNEDGKKILYGLLFYKNPTNPLFDKHLEQIELRSKFFQEWKIVKACAERIFPDSFVNHTIKNATV